MHGMRRRTMVRRAGELEPFHVHGVRGGDVLHGTCGGVEQHMQLVCAGQGLERVGGCVQQCVQRLRPGRLVRVRRHCLHIVPARVCPVVQRLGGMFSVHAGHVSSKPIRQCLCGLS